MRRVERELGSGEARVARERPARARRPLGGLRMCKSGAGEGTRGCGFPECCCLPCRRRGARGGEGRGGAPG